MESFPNSYIGIVDILGYGDFETRLKGYDKETTGALLDRIFDSLERTIEQFRVNTNVVWVRYGDSFVIYSINDDIENLSFIIKKSCLLIALSQNQSIPLRIAITQKTLNVDIPDDGATISGEGWNVLRMIEKSLNWMGGLLYLPHYDGTHQKAVQNLVESTYLIIEQNHVPDYHFIPPFKQDIGFNTARSWFLNWEKCLKMSKELCDRDINNWWSQFPFGNRMNESEEVKEKQANTIKFADYCRTLRQASKLIYFSDINKKSPLKKLTEVVDSNLLWGLLFSMNLPPKCCYIEIQNPF